MFLFQLDEKSGCHCSVKFPFTHDGKIGTCHLLLFSADISTKFDKMFLEKYASNHADFVQMTNFDLLSWQQR